MSDARKEEAPVQAMAQRIDSSPPADAPAIDGDRLTRLFDEHRQKIYRAAYRITGNASDAEDVLQTVFLRLLRLDRGAHLGEHPGRYLHLSAVNGALDLIRARGGGRNTPLEDVEATLSDGGESDPGHAFDSQVLAARVRHAMTALSPNAARAFALRYLEGCDNAEIARALGTSRAVVAVLLHRARARVQRALRSTPEGDLS